MKEAFIRLTAAEIQSGLTRQRYAELLISQMPADHDGRNTWLLNYGNGDEAKALRHKHELTWNDRLMAANSPGPVGLMPTLSKVDSSPAPGQVLR